MNPKDTLLESLDLIIEYGRIPLGEKLKITKVLERQLELLKKELEHKHKSRKLLGLEKYNDF